MLRKIRVPDMHCEHCVKRISDALAEAALNFSVDLDEKTVVVDGCEHCFNTAYQEIYDLGFTPEKIN